MLSSMSTLLQSLADITAAEDDDLATQRALDAEQQDSKQQSLLFDAAASSDDDSSDDSDGEGDVYTGADDVSSQLQQLQIEVDETEPGDTPQTGPMSKGSTTSSAGTAGSRATARSKDSGSGSPAFDDYAAVFDTLQFDPSVFDNLTWDVEVRTRSNSIVILYNS
jgi:hypothetical protein